VRFYTDLYFWCFDGQIPSQTHHDTVTQLSVLMQTSSKKQLQPLISQSVTSLCNLPVMYHHFIQSIKPEMPS
jgi:hypothetical protein